MKKEVKQVVLQSDEFHPKGYFNEFWMVPKEIARVKDLSPGAKLLYGTIMVQCNRIGTAWPKHKKLREDLGDVSEKTLNRWQMELVNIGLLRVLQKGRGLGNNYYLLRSTIIGNAQDGEFDSGPRYLHKNIRTGKQTVVDGWLVESVFKDDIDLWWEDVTMGIDRKFPKPCGHYDRKEYSKIRKEHLENLAEYNDRM
jgi:hypothetical protein